MKSIKKIIVFVLAFAVLSTSLFLPERPVLADDVSASTASMPSADEGSAPYLPETSASGIILKGFFPNVTVCNIGSGKVTKVTNSNKKVADVAIKSDKKGFYYQTLKKGSTVVTVTVKKGSKTYNLKYKITAYDDKPFYYIKYDGKDLYKGYEYRNNLRSGLNTGKTISWKLKPGYTLVSATVERGSSKKIKSGSKLSLIKSEYSFVYLTVKNSKKQTLTYRIAMKK